MKKLVGFIALGIFIIAFIIFIIASLWIGSDVRRYCKTAKKYYGGDCVSSLSQMVDDRSMPFTDRNRAIWALGQLGNTNALPYLTKYFTGIPEKEPQNANLSQYEISKAISLIQGGLNIPAIVWRHNIK